MQRFHKITILLFRMRFSRYFNSISNPFPFQYLCIGKKEIIISKDKGSQSHISVIVWEQSRTLKFSINWEFYYFLSIPFYDFNVISRSYCHVIPGHLSGFILTLVLYLPICITKVNSFNKITNAQSHIV